MTGNVRVSRSVVEALAAQHGVDLDNVQRIVASLDSGALTDMEFSADMAALSEVNLARLVLALRAALADAEAGGVEALVPKWEREVAGHRNNQDGGEDWLRSSHYYANGLEMALKDLRAALQPRREP